MNLKYYEFLKVVNTTFTHKPTGYDIELETTYKVVYRLKGNGEPYISTIHINGTLFISPWSQEEALDLVGDWVYEDIKNRQKAVVKQVIETFKQTA